MRLGLKSAKLASVKATYRIVFGHPVPYGVCQKYEQGELADRLDKAIREMKPLDGFNPHELNELIFPHSDTRPEPLPLSIRALARWQYMRRE